MTSRIATVLISCLLTKVLLQVYLIYGCVWRSVLILKLFCKLCSKDRHFKKRKHFLKYTPRRNYKQDSIYSMIIFLIKIRSNILNTIRKSLLIPKRYLPRVQYRKYIHWKENPRFKMFFCYFKILMAKWNKLLCCDTI